MKKTNILIVCTLSASMILAGCSSMSNTAKGGIIGGTSGAAVGAGVGALIGKGKGAAIGAAIGATVGTTAGVLIGKKMDKKKAELAAIEAAKVEDATDVNGLQAIKVTFDSGILFATNSSTLSSEAKSSLSKFAQSISGDMTDTNITIYGHTDNTGTYEVNTKVSTARAESVANYLKSQGISASRLTTQGLAYDYPVADNSTAAGRAQNRRVEVYISANENMIKAAENGTLQ